MEIDGIPVEDLVQSWHEIQAEYDMARDGEYDQSVLDCVTRLTADPGAETAYVWALALATMAPYLTRPGVKVKQRTAEALQGVDAALRDRPCGHDAHPYQTHDGAAADEELLDLLPRLVDESAEWEEWGEKHPREAWRCPRNVAGYARIALDIVYPGQIPDVPARLSLEDREDIQTLEALLELYPKPWTDVESEISAQGTNLYLAEPEDRPGRLQVVRAVSWHAFSGVIRRKSVLDSLIRGVEKVLPDFAGATCEHDEHPPLSDLSTSAMEVGIVLSSPAGRAVYERERDYYGDGLPLDQIVCPAFMADVARETLTELRAGRDSLFGPRDTSHLDAEYLCADGRLEIGKITERLERAHWNEAYADELGLWAARRYEQGRQLDDRERTVLLLTARQTMKISYPSPPLAVAEGILTVMRAVAAAPRPEACAHADAHPALGGEVLRKALAHFYAPDDHPAAEEGPSAEAWTCPRLAAEVAEECVERLEDLYGDDEDEW
ncbi:hypothetical protein GCM10022245_53320 [Streptomyces mayteni]